MALFLKCCQAILFMLIQFFNKLIRYKIILMNSISLRNHLIKLMRESRKIKTVLIAKPIQEYHPQRNENNIFALNSLLESNAIEKGPRFDERGQPVGHTFVGKPEWLRGRTSQSVDLKHDDSTLMNINTKSLSISRDLKPSQTISVSEERNLHPSSNTMTKREALQQMQNIRQRINHSIDVSSSHEQSVELFNKYQREWQQYQSKVGEIKKKPTQSSLFQAQEDYPLKLELLDSFKKISEKLHYNPNTWVRELREFPSDRKPIKIQLRGLLLHQKNIVEPRFYERALHILKNEQSQIKEAIQVRGLNKFRSELDQILNSQTQSVYQRVDSKSTEEIQEGTIVKFYPRSRCSSITNTSRKRM